AFEKAWKAVCSSKGEISKLIIPAGLRQLDLIAAVHQGIDKFTKGSISLLRLKVVFCSPQ
ncbi:hypothetical protein S83_035588, partial [Arachis hypogaea]